jgi:transcriptional regulator GlxA family with amidase domain
VVIILSSFRLDQRAGGVEGIHPAALKMATYIIGHFQQDLSLADICGRVDLNMSHGARLFKKNFGDTAGNFLREIRVAHAIHLLQRTSRLVVDIAFESGFQSAFREVTGTTPTHYR